MSQELSFQEWSEQFIKEVAKLGLLPIDDEDLLELIHMEGKTVAEAVAEYKAAF